MKHVLVLYIVLCLLEDLFIPVHSWNGIYIEVCSLRWNRAKYIIVYILYIRIAVALNVILKMKNYTHEVLLCMRLEMLALSELYTDNFVYITIRFSFSTRDGVLFISFFRWGFRLKCR